MTGAPGASRLERFARKAAAPPPAATAAERCGLCAAAVPDDHRHLVELTRRALVCACRACALLFDRREAGGARYRLVPDRVRALGGFVLDDVRWASFGVPVGVAFFLRSGPAGGVVAFFPSPLGATEAPLAPDAWAALEADNPVLRGLETDVEALLVRRIGGAREQWIAPVDDCYRLVGIIRTHWKGLGGGPVWPHVERFFAELRRRAVPADGASPGR